MNEYEFQIEMEKIKFQTKENKMKKRGLLHKKFSKLKEIISGLAKQGKNTTQKFAYIKYGQMYAKASSSMHELGLDIIAEVSEVKCSQFENKKGTVTNKVSVVGFIHLTDTDTGFTEKLEWQSEGYDFADKALTKATTFLMKSWLQTNLLIASEKDPDSQTIGNQSNKEIANKDKPLWEQYPFDSKKKLSTQLMGLIKKGVILQEDVISFMDGNKLNKVDDAKDLEKAYKDIVGG